MEMNIIFILEKQIKVQQYILEYIIFNNDLENKENKTILLSEIGNINISTGELEFENSFEECNSFIEIRIGGGNIWSCVKIPEYQPKIGNSYIYPAGNGSITFEYISFKKINISSNTSGLNIRGIIFWKKL